MATTRELTAAKDTAHDASIWPGLKALDENVRKARQLVDEGRHATEQLVSGTVSEVQRHPLRAIALATTGGAIAGCLMGFAFGRRASRAGYDWLRLL